MGFANLSKNSLLAINTKGMKLWWTYITVICIYLCIHSQYLHLGPLEGLTSLWEALPFSHGSENKIIDIAMSMSAVHFHSGLHSLRASFTRGFIHSGLPPLPTMPKASWVGRLALLPALDLIKRLPQNNEIEELWGRFWTPTSGVHMLKSVFMCVSIHRRMHTHKYMKRKNKQTRKARYGMWSL